MRNLLWLAVAATLAPACGGDDGPPPPPAKSTPAAPANAAGRGSGSAASLVTYSKVEGRKDLKPSEVKTVRHRFTPTDFAPDPTGATNRDPFRSYVVAQVSINVGGDGDKPTDDTQKTEKCANKKIAAAGYSTHELKLIGVITRGTVRIATFTDTGHVGWVVRRGDCIGSEHARVKLIGEGFVTLEYPTTATTADPNPHAEEREFRLRERELIDEIGTALDDSADSPRIRRRSRVVEEPTVPPTQPQ